MAAIAAMRTGMNGRFGPSRRLDPFVEASHEKGDEDSAPGAVRPHA